MFSTLHRAISLLTMVFAAFAVPAAACSVGKDYRTLTNFELVQKAELIVLARIVDGPRQFANGSEPFSEQVRIEPVQVLKGVLAAEPLTVTGMIAWNGVDMPSLPSPLSSAHFSVGMGACIRLFYPVGGLVVAMFGSEPPVKGKKALVQLFEPFARVVEDVENADAVWVHAVTEYADMQRQNTGADLRKAVMARRVALAANTKSNEAQAIAADLAHYLDATAPAERPSDNAARWGYFATPVETAAILSKPGSATSEALRCGKDGTGLEVVAFGREGASVPSISISDETFSAKAFAPKLPLGAKAITGLIDFSDTLADLLETTTSPVQINVPGEVAVSAPPADVLQKFAVRCRILLKS